MANIEKGSEDIKYLPNGEVVALTEKGEGIILKYGLNRKFLVQKRSKTINEYVRDLKASTAFSDKLLPLDNDYIQDFLKLFLFDIFEKIRGAKAKWDEFPDLNTYIWSNFEIFFEPLLYKQDWVVIKIAYKIFNSKDEINFKNLYASNLTKIPIAYLDRLRIQNYFSLQDIELNNLKGTKEIYFLGENGDGKTLLLQAILISLKKSYLDYIADKNDVGKILQYINENNHFSFEYALEDFKNVLTENSLEYLKNIYAYGINRHQNTDSVNKDFDREGYLTLFNDRFKLLNPVAWLKDVKLEEGRSKLTIKIAIELLENLLDNDVKIELKGKEVTFTDVRFKEQKPKGLKFEQLSDGYKNIMIWVADLVARLAERQPDTDFRDYVAIVLVDEVGLHLHPKWEAKLVKKLRTWLPKIQFFFTTHSPVLLLNASEDAVFYRLYKEDGVSKISEKFQCSDFSDLRLNSLATSHLFGLESSGMRSNQSNEMDTSTHFRTNRIRKMVDKEVQKLQEEGKVYIPPFILDDIIKKALKEQNS